MGIGAPAIDLDDAGGNDIEEVAVVGDENDGPREIFQHVFQPADRLGIEMVGRLIEQKKIRLAGERAAECDAAFLSTGKRAGGGFERGGAEGV